MMATLTCNELNTVENSFRVLLSECYLSLFANWDFFFWSRFNIQYSPNNKFVCWIYNLGNAALMLLVSLFAISVWLEIIFEKVKKKRIFNTLENESTLTILKIIFHNFWFCENFIAALSTQHDLGHILKFYMARLW